MLAATYLGSLKSIWYYLAVAEAIGLSSSGPFAAVLKVFTPSEKIPCWRGRSWLSIIWLCDVLLVCELHLSLEPGLLEIWNDSWRCLKWWVLWNSFYRSIVDSLILRVDGSYPRISRFSRLICGSWCLMVTPLSGSCEPYRVSCTFIIFILVYLYFR